MWISIPAKKKEPKKKEMVWASPMYSFLWASPYDITVFLGICTIAYLLFTKFRIPLKNELSLQLLTTVLLPYFRF